MDIYDQLILTGKPIEIRAKELAKGVSPGVGFPPSYIDFVRRFGMGLLCGRFLIYPPMAEHPDSFHRQSAGIKWAFDQTLQLNDPSFSFQLEPDGSPELVKRLVGFATGENGESLFWDVSVGVAEFPIYITGSGFGLRFAGKDLRDFIRRITDVKSVQSLMKFTKEPMPLTFEVRRQTR